METAATRRLRYLSQKEKVTEQGKAWRTKNIDRVRKNNSAYKAANKEKIRAKELLRIDPAKVAARARLWHRNNPERCVAREAARRAMKMQRTPKWADHFIMQEIYHLSALRTRITGIKWHVDHIVPLKSKLVCGLHCEQNLAVVPASYNMKKHNTFWPLMP